MRKFFIVAAVAALSVCVLDANVALFDDRIAVDRSQPGVDGLEWIDGASLPMESRGFPIEELATPYQRIPKNNAQSLPKGIVGMGPHSTGQYFLFSTDSDTLAVEWELASKYSYDPYIPPQGMIGVDIYQFEPVGEGLRTLSVGGWRFLKNGRVSTNAVDKTSVSLRGAGMKGILVYLPTRGVVNRCRIGVKAGSKIGRWNHASGITKPVVHYGTSIVHGGCASRPGLCFANQAGRLADVPYVNLGFSGRARLEIEMAELIARIDASLYIVDPVWNCDVGIINERLEAFLRKLHAARPEVPILVCEGGEPSGRRMSTNDALKKVYDNLTAEGSSLSKMLRFLPAEGMLPLDGEATHDYCHPNDYGSMKMGEVFAKKIRSILLGGERDAVAKAENPGVFKIASFNIRCCSSADEGPRRWYKRMPAVAEVIRSHGFDVFGVQEMMECEAEVMKLELPGYKRIGCGRGKDRKDEAMYIFYDAKRFECLESGTFWLSETPDEPGSKYPGAGCPRTCTWALLLDHNTGKKFRYFNTHLDHISPQARIDGLNVLLKRGVYPAKANGETVFLTGDLNETLDAVDSPETVAEMCGPKLSLAAKNNPIALLSTVLRDTITLSEIPHQGTFRTFNGYADPPRCRIDYVYSTENVRVLRHETINDKVDWMFPSDHYPVSALVEIR